jgi:predicted Zn-dependent protease
MKDWNICEHCNLYVALDQASCPNCHQSLVLDAKGKISLWRLGDIQDGVVGHIACNLSEAFGLEGVIQPTFIDERPSHRPKWKGISSDVFLEQVFQRHQKGSFVSIGVTEENIVPNSKYNFLFGYAYVEFPAAVVSLHALSWDDPSQECLIERASHIAVHEIGHTLGLDHHAYEDEVDCVMVGDEQVDSLETVDQGTSRFCAECRKVVDTAFAKRR